jgi:hypothetical protein
MSHADDRNKQQAKNPNHPHGGHLFSIKRGFVRAVIWRASFIPSLMAL